MVIFYLFCLNRDVKLKSTKGYIEVVTICLLSIK